jgi:hypothetical protein
MPYPGFHKKRNDERQDIQPEPIRHPKEQQDTAGKTETFVSRNIKLLTFLACMAVIVMIMAGFGMYRARHYGDDVKEPDNVMTVNQMQTLVAKGEALTWRDFDGYACEVVSENIAYVCCYDVEGGDYCFMVTSETKGTPIISVIWVDFTVGEQTEIFAPEKQAQ